MISSASRNSFPSYISTNGLLLERDAQRLIDAGLSVLRVSLDGIDQEMLARYRVRGDFGKVVRGVKKIIRLRRDGCTTVPLVSLQMLVTRHTQDHIEEFLDLARLIGVDEVYLKSFNLSLSDWLTQTQRQSIAEQFLPTDERFLRYQLGLDGQYILRPEIIKAPCPEIDTGMTILHTGDVVACCEDFRGNYILGNIRRQSLEEIWFGERYREMRGRVRVRALPMCRECAYPGSSEFNQVIRL
jgi:radical SAM protein with 4Fe4S-binding SPASM domain